MKKHSFILASLAVVFAAAVGSPNLRAQCMLNSNIAGGFTSIFPAGISAAFGVVGPNANGDYLVIGNTSGPAIQSTLSLLPLPNVAGGTQQFCSTIPVTPGAMYFSYVPTAAERAGDFSAFAAQLASLDGFPFPNGIFSTDTTVWGWRVPAGESIYVSTGTGGQILTVDGNVGTVKLLSNGPFAGELSFPWVPQAMAFGQDNRLYIADPPNSRIWRMNQDGSGIELVYSKSVVPAFNFPACVLAESGLNCPSFPQGPSFKNDASGDLYFDTEFSGVYKIAGVAAPGTVTSGGAFNSALNLISAVLGPGSGEGTGFDATGDLLAVASTVDGVANQVESLAPPYTGTPTALVTGLNGPTAVALNRSTGQLLVSNTNNQQILSITGSGCAAGTAGCTGPYIGFGPSDCNLFTNCDLPAFMQFDTTGHLFVLTNTDGVGRNAKLWRVDDPAPTPTATLLAAIPASSPSTLPQAIGVAVPASSPESESIVVTGNAQTLTFSFDNNAYGVSFTIPAGFLPPGTVVTDTPADTPQAVWATEADNYSGTTIAPIDALNGDGVVHTVTLTCPAGMLTCEPPPADTYSATIFWESSQIDFCTLSPGLLKEEIGSTTWFNLEQSCANYADPGHGISGSSNDSLSRWAAVSGVPPTPAAAVTIVAPANGATYAQGEVVPANYSCSGPSVVACAGTVGNTQNIDTSLGPHTFTANALVTAGPGGSASATYSVIQNFVFVGFGPPVNNPPALNVANAGRAIPISFQVLDTNNNPISTMTMPPVSIVDVQESCANLDSLMLATLADATASGSSGFQNLGGGFYQFNWKTSSAWAGTCRQLQVNLGDGILHVADFRFK